MANVRDFAFEAIADLRQATTTAQVLATLDGVSSYFGIENFCISGVPLPNETLAPYVMLSGWPPDWLDRYNRNNYVHIDPVIAKLKTTTDAFEWSEAPYDRAPASPAARMMNEAAEFGLAQGLCVPVYSTSGFQAVVTFGGRHVAFTPDSKAALHLVGLYAHSCLRELLSQSGNRAAKKAVSLSPRELECLKWAAEGETAKEIAYRVALSTKTVEEYLKSAALKLQARNRVQAVAAALRSGVIH